MICKYCGNEIPDNSTKCFICDKEVRIDKDRNMDGRENRFSLSNNDYKKAKRRLIISYISIPFLICVLIFMFICFDPIISIILTIISIIYVPIDIKNNINIVKEGKEKNVY